MLNHKQFLSALIFLHKSINDFLVLHVYFVMYQDHQCLNYLLEVLCSNKLSHKSDLQQRSSKTQLCTLWEIHLISWTYKMVILLEIFPVQYKNGHCLSQKHKPYKLIFPSGCITATEKVLLAAKSEKGTGRKFWVVRPRVISTEVMVTQNLIQTQSQCEMYE